MLVYLSLLFGWLLSVPATCLCTSVCLWVDCLASQQHASVPQFVCLWVGCLTSQQQASVFQFVCLLVGCLASQQQASVPQFVCLLVDCLTSQQQASVSQGRICSDNFTCCHTEIQVADQTFYLTQSQCTDTGPTSPSSDPITPGAWQGSHWNANF